MKGYERLLAVLIAATLVAGVAGLFVKDTTPGGPIAVDSPTPTLTFSPSETTSPSASPTLTASASPTRAVDQSPEPTASPSKTRRPKPPVDKEPPDTPKTGVGSNLLLASILLGAAALLNRARRAAA